MNSHYNVIIVAGGTGSRMQSTVPKQFIEIKGKPILIHTIEKFMEFDEFIHVVVCVHKDYLTEFRLKFKNNILPHTENNHLNNNLINGVNEKIVI